MLAADGYATRKCGVGTNGPVFWEGPERSPRFVFLVKSALGICGESVFRLGLSGKCDTEGGRLAHHPSQCDVCQGRSIWVIGITSTYVAVNPGEPDLLDGLARSRLLIPERRRKFAAPLVNGKGLVGVLNV